MKITLKKIIKAFVPYGLVRLRHELREKTPKELEQDFAIFKKQKEDSPNCNDFVFGKLYPCLHDKADNSGSAKGGYFHQDLLVARRIYENKPKKHVDIGSRVDGFCAHVASFREITVLDIRPSLGKSHNITFVQQDFMGELDSKFIEAYDSVSCLHAMEHFGLGRYGDPLNYDGHLVGINNLHKLLKTGGKLYFSVPIGTPQRIEFHAHRIFSPKYLYELFSKNYRIDFFSYVDGYGDLHENLSDIEFFVNHYHDNYGCGIFELTKL